MAKKPAPADLLPLPKAPIQRLTRPFARFLEIESASGLILLVCAVVAMVAANSALADPYHHFFETHVRIGIADFTLDQPIHFWINDALMTLFFFVVGLEIKRELVAGELSSPQKALLPVIAAVGGMVVPALIYLALEIGLPGERGWGIPMATDIAFVVGVLAVFGQRVPFALKIFLLALAIVDDIGAILVIAVAYSTDLNWYAMGLAVAGFGVIYILNRLGVRTVSVYILFGAGIWLAVLKSGVHPTIAGVMLGLLTPASAWVGQTTLREALSAMMNRLAQGDGRELHQLDLKRLQFHAREAASPLERLEMALLPWVGFIIMPLFALANAGVHVHPESIYDRVAVAVALGLLVGKPIGIVGFSYLAVKLGLAEPPTGVSWRVLFAGGCLGGIGFTMSLFVAQLAFPTHPELLDGGKIGILVGSSLSAAVGIMLLLITLPKKGSTRI
jgi:NhaA family Na+:H+ antiporter